MYIRVAFNMEIDNDISFMVIHVHTKNPACSDSISCSVRIKDCNLPFGVLATSWKHQENSWWQNRQTQILSWFPKICQRLLRYTCVSNLACVCNREGPNEFVPKAASEIQTLQNQALVITFVMLLLGASVWCQRATGYQQARAGVGCGAGRSIHVHYIPYLQGCFIYTSLTLSNLHPFPYYM